MAARIVPESDKRADWPRLVHQFSKDASIRLAALEASKVSGGFLMDDGTATATGGFILDEGSA